MFKQIFSPALLNFWLFIAFAVGIILGFYLISLAFFIFLFLFSIVLTVIFYKRQRLLFADIFIVFLFISLGALWYFPYTFKNIDSFLNERSTVVLQITSLPKESSLNNISFARIKKINNVKVDQKIRVVDYTRMMTYLNGYKVTGKLGKRQFRGKDFYTLWVKSNNIPEELPASIWGRFMQKTTSQLLDILRNNLNNGSYRFLASVFLGRRELLSNTEKDIFRNAGISHLLAISGSHIGLSALVLFFILKLFNITFRVRLFVSVVFLFLYTFITGVSPPTLRASMMYCIFSLSFFMKRKTNPLNSLGLCGFICLLLSPQWIFDLGFQLSFLSIFALILGFKLFPMRASKPYFINNIKYLFFCSAYINLLILPLVSYYFGKINILNILNNIVLVPFFMFILIMNFLLIIFSPLNFISESIGRVISFAVHFFYKLSGFLGSFQFSFITFHFSLFTMLIYYVLFLVIILVLFHLKSQSRVIVTAFKAFDKA